VVGGLSAATIRTSLRLRQAVLTVSVEFQAPSHFLIIVDGEQH
jgi:hypothetical protein